MPRWILLLLSLVVTFPLGALSQEAVFPGADETTLSRSEYFTWINNTNEGATHAQTVINLDFFQWLQDEYGMRLDIYAFDAGAVDGKRFYGSTKSDRFKEQFPEGFDPIYRKAKAMGTRLGLWGGPDGFGDTLEEEKARTKQMVGLCRDFEWALFKFDSVCGPLRPEKEEAFINMMIRCRRYSPDLILLNHRLGLERAQAHATTFLWEGKETYIDVFSANRIIAPHHRADAISRGLVPGLKRLTEDHGVCLSSCLDYWEDDLVLQAFNRSLILSPQLYGSPWLLKDEEFCMLARIFNLHRKYRELLVNGMVLPEERFGPFAVSRGDDETRLITLRNLTWRPVTYTFSVDEQVGITHAGPIHCRQFHPTERILGDLKKGETIKVRVPPFRACLLMATARICDEPGVTGCDYEVVRNVPDKPVLIRLKGRSGLNAEIALAQGAGAFNKALLNNREAPHLLEGDTLEIRFPGQSLCKPPHRMLGELSPCKIPSDVEALYEATVYAADNNALEVRSLFRSGPTTIPQVKKARDAFFQQPVFVERGIWDRNLFDGDRTTGFWPSRRYGVDQRIKGGCFRLDLGEVLDLDRIVLHVPDDFSLQPLLIHEGNHVEVSKDLEQWKRLTYLADKHMVILLDEPVRYLRFRYYAHRITEIEGFKNGRPVSREKWRASNLFAHPSRLKPVKAWHGEAVLDEWVKGSYLCIAVEGSHGVEGAYAALRVGGRLIGCPDRAPSYPSNTWEYINARGSRNYTYYAPVTEEMTGSPIDLFVIAYDEGRIDLHSKVWITAYPPPEETMLLKLERNSD